MKKEWGKDQFIQEDTSARGKLTDTLGKGGRAKEKKQEAGRVERMKLRDTGRGRTSPNRDQQALMVNRSQTLRSGGQLQWGILRGMTVAMH